MTNYQVPTMAQKLNAYENMMTRTTNENYHKVRPSYKNKSVCKEWQGREGKQAFYAWFESHYYSLPNGEPVQVDKDIKVKGNTVYSADTCLIVPRSINAMFTSCERKSNSDPSLPLGVKLNQKTGLYLTNQDSRIVNGVFIVSGQYETIEEAFEVYRALKLASFHDAIEKYKDVVPQEVYDAVMNWDIDIND